MAQSYNPFEIIELRLNSIEDLLLDIKHKYVSEPSEQHLDIDGICNYLPDRPKKSTIYGKVHRQEIPCHKQGKKLYFLKSEIDLWLKQGRKKTLKEIDSEAQNYFLKKKGSI